MYQTSITETCSVHITTNRNRVKTYSSNVYLQDEQKFELEIHNPHPFKVLAKIKLNGNYISSSGLVLRPGERVYLERFLDKNEAFVFSTYEVEDTGANKKAISKNGDVEVEFYSEFVPNSNSLYLGRSTWVTQPTYTYSSIITTTTINAANFQHSASLDSPKSIETGRVEGGETTDQNFTFENSSYNSWAFEVVKLKILPASQKPITVSEIRNYCTECGTRVKKSSWKFCPNCGNKF